MLCPLVNKELAEDECYLTALALEGAVPKNEAVDGAFECPDCEEICEYCQYHD